MNLCENSQFAMNLPFLVECDGPRSSQPHILDPPFLSAYSFFSLFHYEKYFRFKYAKEKINQRLEQ